MTQTEKQLAEKMRIYLEVKDSNSFKPNLSKMLLERMLYREIKQLEMRASNEKKDGRL